MNVNEGKAYYLYIYKVRDCPCVQRAAWLVLIFFLIIMASYDYGRMTVYDRSFILTNNYKTIVLMPQMFQSAKN